MQFRHNSCFYLHINGWFKEDPLLFVHWLWNGDNGQLHKESNYSCECEVNAQFRQVCFPYNIHFCQSYQIMEVILPTYNNYRSQLRYDTVLFEMFFLLKCHVKQIAFLCDWMSQATIFWPPYKVEGNWNVSDRYEWDNRNAIKQMTTRWEQTILID